MNKFSFSTIQIGDIFQCTQTKNLYRLTGKKECWKTGGMLYEFIDMKIDQPWTFSKKQFMKRLKPIEGAAAVLYDEIQDR